VRPALGRAATADGVPQQAPLATVASAWAPAGLGAL